MASDQEPKLFWRIKVVAGVLLILGVLDAQFTFYLPLLFDTPRSLAQVFVLLGAGSVIYHFLVLRQASGSMASPKALAVRGGLYAWVRHPMYLSDIVMYSGFLLFAFSWPSIVVYSIAISALYQQALAEDNFMALKFRDEHLRWSQHSALLLPKLF